MSREDMLNAHLRTRPLRQAKVVLTANPGPSTWDTTSFARAMRRGGEVGPKDLPVDRMKVYLNRASGKVQGTHIRLGFSMACYSKLWKHAGQPDLFGYLPRLTEDGTLYLRPVHKVLKLQNDDDSWREVYRKCENTRDGTTFNLESWTFEIATVQQPDKNATSWFVEPGAAAPEVVSYMLDDEGYVALELPRSFMRANGGAEG